jgi:predicted HicB family RNase H-like nuclease
MTSLTKKIILRVTEQEHQTVKQDADRLGVSVNTYIRRLVVGLPDSIESRLQALESKVND